jgi:hypothetical protein
MTGPLFLQRVRALAANSANVFIVVHARKRMAERGHTDGDVLQCLRRGIIDEGPFFNARNNWQATLRRTHAGQEIKVVAALEARVIVITVV